MTIVGHDDLSLSLSLSLSLLLGTFFGFQTTLGLDVLDVARATLDEPSKPEILLKNMSPEIL